MQIGDPDRERRYQIGSLALLVGVLIVTAIVGVIVNWIAPTRDTHAVVVGVLVLALPGLWSLWNAAR